MAEGGCEEGRDRLEATRCRRAEKAKGNQERERERPRSRRSETSRRGKRGGGGEDAGGQEDWSGAREIKQLVTLRRGSSQRDLIMFSV